METDINNFGYNSFFEQNRVKLNLTGFAIGRVITELKEAYKVQSSNGIFLAKITGKQIYTATSREDFPAVGDWVSISELSDGQAVIVGLLPRQTIIKRKHGDKNRAGEKINTQIIAANVDVAFIVESIDRDYNLNRFERYFSIAEDGGVIPAIILNKIDLLPPDILEEKLDQMKARFPGVDIILTSATNRSGLEELKEYMKKGKTYCFLGSSGVGKSSLINSLIGNNSIKTDNISTHSNRGKHTTTARQMYFLENGAIVIDNPGMREIGIAETNNGVDTIFQEISELSKLCKFSDCSHTNEKGCNVIDAVETGKLDKDKYANYINLKKEADYYEMSDYEKRKKDRQFGKYIKISKKELTENGHKYF